MSESQWTPTEKYNVSWVVVESRLRDALAGRGFTLLRHETEGFRVFRGGPDKANRHLSPPLHSHYDVERYCKGMFADFPNCCPY